MKKKKEMKTTVRSAPDGSDNKLYKHLAVEINVQVHLVGVSEHCTHSSGRECALYTVPEQGVVK